MTYKKTGIFLLLVLLVAVYLVGCGTPVDVPNLQRLTEVQVKERAIDSGFTLKEEFAFKRNSGNEIVMNQFPFPGKTISKGDTVTVQMADLDFQNAIGMAAIQIQEANSLLQKCKANGINVSDLSSAITQAQSIYNKAKTIDELVGQQNSAVFFANTVINACMQRLGEKHLYGY